MNPNVMCNRCRHLRIEHDSTGECRLCQCGALNTPGFVEAENKDSVYRRPEWDEYFLDIALVVSNRADCRRRRHGAVIVKDRRIVSTGYNGSPSGDPRSCIAGECPRGRLNQLERPSNKGDYTDCIALHAEMNAIAYADRVDMQGATLYITPGPPCPMCAKLIMAAGIIRVVNRGEKI